MHGEGKHTPGPWKAHRGYVGPGAGTNRKRVAAVLWEGRGRTEYAANARLIASAPTLLAENVRLREALTPFAESVVRVAENELGEEYMQCDECGGQDWGSDPDSFDSDKHDTACAYKPETLRATARAALTRSESEDAR